MKNDQHVRTKRRQFLAASAALPLALAVGTLAVGTLARRSALAATPACGDGPTPRQTAGPFFKPDSPQRQSLVDAGVTGDVMTLAGRVLSTSCEPVAGALIDFWHCDAKGNYDNRGYRFRGHQFADTNGRYQLETSMPGLYPGRTRHIHVIVQAPNRRPVTTQLYFPGERLNDKDFIYDPVLLMNVSNAGTPLRAQFDFVLKLG
jgi:protocatechuate 3,4-dioxygenase beta subunit